MQASLESGKLRKGMKLMQKPTPGTDALCCIYFCINWLIRPKTHYLLHLFLHQLLRPKTHYIYIFGSIYWHVGNTCKDTGGNLKSHVYIYICILIYLFILLCTLSVNGWRHSMWASPCNSEATLMAKRDLQHLGEDCLDDLSQPPPASLKDAEDITHTILIPRVDRPAGPAFEAIFGVCFQGFGGQFSVLAVPDEGHCWVNDWCQAQRFWRNSYDDHHHWQGLEGASRGFTREKGVRRRRG